MAYNPYIVQSGGAGALLQGGGGNNLQGSSPNLQGGSINLQGPGAISSSTPISVQPAASPQKIKFTSGKNTNRAVSSSSGGSSSYSPFFAILSESERLAKQQAEAQRRLIEEQQQKMIAMKQQQRDSTLGFVEKRRGQLNDVYSDNKRLAQEGYGANVATAEESASLSLKTIDEALSQTLTQAEKVKTDTIEAGEKGRIDVEDTLRREFSGRNALDSTFYARALAEETADIIKQKNDQLFQVSQIVQTAKTQASLKQQEVKNQLNSIKRDLDIKKNTYLTTLQQQYNQGVLGLDELTAQTTLESESFASELEIQKIGQLQQIQFNLDNYLLGLKEREANIRLQMSQNSAALAASDPGKDLNASLGYAKRIAQFEDAGIVPPGTLGTYLEGQGITQPGQFDDGTYGQAVKGAATAGQNDITSLLFGSGL